MTAFKANLDRELARRAARGELPGSVAEFERRLRTVGYRRLGGDPERARRLVTIALPALRPEVPQGSIGNR